MRKPAAADSSALNRQQFFRMVERLRGFRSLVAMLEVEAAARVARRLYDAELRDANLSERYIQVPADERQQFAAKIDALLYRECDQIRDKRAYVVELLHAAQAGRLHDRLKEMIEPQVNYAPRHYDPRLSRAEREIAAAAWIGSVSHGESWQVAREVLTREVLTAPAGPALGDTPQLLDEIQARIAADAPPVRSPKAEAAYPSSIGGRYLLELVFEFTADTRWPPQGHPGWLDAALFYLGAVTTVQGYPDGNKRIGRLAYAITVLKGGRPFVAPNLELQAELMWMTDVPQA